MCLAVLVIKQQKKNYPDYCIAQWIQVFSYPIGPARARRYWQAAVNRRNPGESAGELKQLNKVKIVDADKTPF